ncbi:MAG: hypothetical protein GX564_13845 [Oligosphaeraceae bacterium]|nr:hypothetical protein [Oligosphaeraceae bacterium]
MRDDLDPYSPCYCGSGKKYRFCCQRKKSNRLGTAANRERKVVLSDIEEGERLHAEGVKYMQQGQFEQAIPWFAKALAMNRDVFNPANNLALCLFITGKIKEAIHVQKQAFEDSLLPNPFGLANLSLFLLFLGDEQGADEAASLAAGHKALNEDAVIKVCEMLSRFRRHSDIIETADASDFGSDPHVLFYTGVAAANLGNRDRARADLSRLPIGHFKAAQAQPYLQHLQNNTQPNTVRQDWPYLLPEEFYVSRLLAKDDATKIALLSRRYMVDFAEALLNANPDDTQVAMKLLEESKHPEATVVLQLIMKGSFGSDQLRCQAASLLAQKGEIKPGEELEIFRNEKNTKEKIFAVCLNPAITYGEMPPGIATRYKQLVRFSGSYFADWEKISAGYHELLLEAPDFFPLRYNYAISLANYEQNQEAENILRSLVAEHPEYLFARASLLNILVHTKRLEEAEQLAKRTDFPKETHPDAYVAWLISLTVFCEAIGAKGEAFQSIKVAQEMDQDNPNVAWLWRKWKNYKDKTAPAAGLATKRQNKK